VRFLFPSLPNDCAPNAFSTDHNALICMTPPTLMQRFKIPSDPFPFHTRFVLDTERSPCYQRVIYLSNSMRFALSLPPPCSTRCRAGVSRRLVSGLFVGSSLGAAETFFCFRSSGPLLIRKLDRLADSSPVRPPRTPFFPPFPHARVIASFR